MNANARAGMLLAFGFLIGIAMWAVGVDPTTSSLAVLAGAFAAGDLVLLEPSDRAALPLSFAITTVVVTAGPWQAVVVVIAAETVACVVNPALTGVGQRLVRMAQRCTGALVADIVYQAALSLNLGPQAVDLTALTLAAIAPIAVADVVGLLRNKEFPAVQARSADVAIVTSGVLMAVGYQGIAGVGRLGLWGPVLFSIPLIAAWYSFQLLASTRRSFEQTVLALAAAPELGGLVRVGHAGRVGDLAVVMGRSLGLSNVDLEHLHTAALLHHLGAVCLDEPEDGAALDPVAVATAGANMLRASDVLAPAGNVVAAEPLLHRPPGTGEPAPAALSGMILKVASAYDELTEGNDEHAAWAVEALYTGPGYVYDGRVLGALERALERRGALAIR